MKKILTWMSLVLISTLCAGDLLRSCPDWNILALDGAKGGARVTAESIATWNDHDGGFVSVASGRKFALKPGKTYRLSAQITGENGMRGGLLLAFRSPYPATPLVALGNGEKKELALYFQALPQETEVAVMVTVYGKGKAEIRNLMLEEFAFDAQERNLIKRPEYHFVTFEIGGAKGVVRKIDAGYEISKLDSGNGYFLFRLLDAVPVVPLRKYMAEMTVESLDGSARSAMQLIVQGAGRTPYPTSSEVTPLGRRETLKLFFETVPGEQSVLLNLLVHGSGRVVLSSVKLTELNDETYRTMQEQRAVKSTQLEQSLLQENFSVQGALRVIPSKQGISFETYPHGAGSVGCESLDWKADQIQAVEVRWRAEDEPGYLRLDFTSEFDGKKHSAYQTMSSFADGETHTLFFPVSESPFWKGRITGLKLSWVALGGCVVTLEKITALSEKNIIPDAAAFAVAGGVRKITNLRPRGEYRFWGKGESNNLPTLQIFDYAGNLLKTVKPGAADQPMLFVAPEQSADAILTGDVSRGALGNIVLELVNLPPLDRPAAYWRGAWIWSRGGMGPELVDVYFKKEFELAAAPVIGEITITGDDRLTLYVNGVEFASKTTWHVPEQFNIAKALKPGKNEIIVKVYNEETWGGLLADCYIACADGSELSFSTDESWLCREKEGRDISAKSFIIATPPAMPWGATPYIYTGAKGRVQPQGTLTDGVMKFQVEKKIPLKSDKVKLSIRHADGRKKNLTVAVSPSTDRWENLQEVRFNLPPIIGKNNEEVELFLDSEFIEVSDGRPLGKVAVIAQKNVPLSSARIKQAGERAFFEINGENVIPLYLDLPHSVRLVPGEKDYLYKNSLRMGSRIVRFPQRTLDIWKSEDVYDFSGIDRVMENLVRELPDSKVILGLDFAMPQWWREKYPDEVTRFYQDKPVGWGDAQTLASSKWIADSQRLIRKLVEHVRKQPYADRLIGMVVAEGWNWEWFWTSNDASGARAYSDFAPAALRRYREYLAKRYGDDATLQKAWNRSDVTLANALPTVGARRDNGTVGVLLDPARDREVMDYFEFRSVVLGEAIEALCRTVKEATDSKWLAGAYYGYLIPFSYIYHKHQEVGHNAIAALARSPYVDFQVGPSYYAFRKSGLADSPMQPVEAYTLHNKLIIVEQDIRNFSDLNHYEAYNGRLNSVEESLGALDRAFAIMLTRGIATHWMEMNEIWYREPVVLDHLKKQIDLYASLPEKPRGTTPREVCIISDVPSIYYQKNNQGDSVSQLAISELFRRINEAGFAFSHVLTEDLPLQKPAKLYIMTSSLMLSPDQRTQLMARFEREGAAVIWLYGAGIFTPEAGPDPKLMGDLLKMDFTMRTQPEALTMNITPEWGGGKVRHFTVTSPWFLPQSGYDEVLATLEDSVTPAMTSKKIGNATHYFAAVPNLPPSLLRQIAAKHGVFIYEQGFDPLHIGNDFVFLHAKTGGKKQLVVPEGMTAEMRIGQSVGKELAPDGSFDAQIGRTYGFEYISKQEKEEQK